MLAERGHGLNWLSSRFQKRRQLVSYHFDEHPNLSVCSVQRLRSNEGCEFAFSRGVGVRFIAVCPHLLRECVAKANDTVPK